MTTYIAHWRKKQDGGDKKNKEFSQWLSYYWSSVETYKADGSWSELNSLATTQLDELSMTSLGQKLNLHIWSRVGCAQKMKHY